MHNQLTVIIGIAASCGVLVVITEPLMIRLLRRASAMDVPCARSSHTVPTPRGGGLPIAAVLVLACLMLHTRDALAFAIAVAAFAAIGFADDLVGLPVIRRLALQVTSSAACAAILVGRLGLSPVAATAAAVLIAFWITGFVNAFNFMDGINGISAAHAAVGGVAYACLGAWRHELFLVGVGAAVAAAALAFLPWNAVRARVFLGDVGSYGLGAALAVLAAVAAIDGVPVDAAVAPLALYVADTAWTLQRRIRGGARWLEPHRTHTYQRLCDVGWSHQRVTVVTTASTVVLSLLGAASLISHLDFRIASDAAGLALLVLYLRSPTILSRTYAKPEARPDMRILMVTHYFPPETGAPQARLSGLAAAWAAGGDEVTVLTGMPNHPTGVLPPQYRGAIRRRERVDGYRLVRTWLYATPNDGIVRKTLSHVSFMISAVLLGLRASGPADVVVVSSPTFFSIGAGWLLARLKRAGLVIEVRDLWPAIFVELGVLTNRRVIRLLERLELAAYAAADNVVVVSEGFRANLMTRGVSPVKVHTIYNGVALNQFEPCAASDPQVRARLGGGPSDCVVLYAGTHGISHGLPGVAAAAAHLRGDPVHFAFVGEGADKPRLQQCVDELRLTNVTMLPGIPHEEVPALLSAADICLVPLRDVPLFAAFIPSKMFEYLAAQKAVVAAVSGEAAKILREAGAVVVPPGDAEALAAAIRTLAADPAKRAAMGRQGRSYVEKFFDRSELARQYRKIIDVPGGHK